MKTISTSLGLVFATCAAIVAARSTAEAQRPRVITVHMLKDSIGMHYRPATVTVRVGDTVRFVNGDGKHNVSFPADSNLKAKRLPAASPLLEKPNDVFDLPVALRPGKYVFQCDPHVKMGMVGHLVVRAK